MYYYVRYVLHSVRRVVVVGSISGRRKCGMFTHGFFESFAFFVLYIQLAFSKKNQKIFKRWLQIVHIRLCAAARRNLRDPTTSLPSIIRFINFIGSVWCRGVLLFSRARMTLGFREFVKL